LSLAVGDHVCEFGFCVLHADEVEKGIGGVESSAHTDSGTTARVFGHLLTWLQESRAPFFLVGTAKVPGIKIHDTRMIRLMEVLLDGGAAIVGRRATELQHAVVARFHLSAEQYGINQLRYDLRKLKAHGLLERDGRRYAYRLTDKGLRVALLFLLFHQRLCGPLAHSLFHHRPDPKVQLNSPLEAAYHKAPTRRD
jgi:hypothetical protein